MREGVLEEGVGKFGGMNGGVVDLGGRLLQGGLRGERADWKLERRTGNRDRR